MNFLFDHRYPLSAALAKLLLASNTYRNFPRRTLLVNIQGFRFAPLLLLSHTEEALIKAQLAKILQILCDLQ